MSKLLNFLGLKKLDLPKYKEIQNQLQEFKDEKYSHKAYYISNLLKVGLGLEPSRISATNRFSIIRFSERPNYFVNSYIIKK